jgi:hypothetical protein
VNSSGWIFVQLLGNSIAAVTEEKDWGHSQSANVNKPVAQIENLTPMPTDQVITSRATASEKSMRENGLDRVIHSLCPRDPAPSDFGLVSHV